MPPRQRRRLTVWVSKAGWRAIVGVFLGAGAVAVVAVRAARSFANASSPGGATLLPAEPSTPALGPKTTSSGRLSISLTPTIGPIQVGVIQDWRIAIAQASGSPASDCSVIFTGTMPEHGHGLPTAPRVTGKVGGTYRLEGVRFSMPGLWRVTVQVSGCVDPPDRAQFDLAL